MKISQHSFLHAATALAFAALSGQAVAVDDFEYFPVTCNTMSDKGVSVKECSTGPDSGTFEVSNASSSVIDFFMVSTDVTYTPKVQSSRSNWYARYRSEEYFNTNLSGMFGKSFDQLFGTNDTGVFHFFSQGNAIAAGENTGPQFSFDAPLKSNMIAGNGGTILAQSFNAVAAVPEPGTYAMMGLGLLGLGAAVRRQHRAH